MITTRTTCRLCLGPTLDPILDLGELVLSTFVDPVAAAAPLPRAPLDLVQCRTCALVQLRHTVDPDQLYRQYWYRSSINEAMQAELTDVVRAALREVSVYPEDLVLDVGANDGYLLSRYPKERAGWSTPRMAFEPAENLAAACRPHCDALLQALWPPTDLAWLDPWRGRMKIVTTVAMFYDLDDPVGCVRAVDAVLHPDGVWIVQFQDLGQMIDQTAFDNLCHEHLTYWSLETFLRTLSGWNLQVTHAEQRAINGGSLRLHVRRRSYPVRASVDHCLLLERLSISWQALERFAWKVAAARTQITDVVGEAVRRGLTVDLYGASTKANTLLQYCGLGAAQIRQAWERNREKIGRMTATGIPIVTEEAGRADPPDVLLVGIWQFRETVLQREREYLAAGGRILFPLPEVDLVVGAKP